MTNLVSKKMPILYPGWVYYRRNHIKLVMYKKRGLMPVTKICM